MVFCLLFIQFAGLGVYRYIFQYFIINYHLKNYPLKLSIKKIFLFLIAATSLTIANAQILTIDKTDTLAYDKKTVVKGDLAIGLEGDKQKTLLLDATNTLNMQVQHNKELLILAASYRFTYNGGQDFLNAGYVHLRWRHAYKNTWQPENFVQYQWDQSRGMMHRFIAGTNARYNFWHKNNWEISVGSGLMYETELWNYVGVDSAAKPVVQPNQQTSLLKSNTYVRWEGKVSNNSNLSLVVFYQTPFNNLFVGYRLASSLHFDVAVSKHFNFGIAFSSLYDSRPVVPIVKFYYNFSNAITYSF